MDLSFLPAVNASLNGLAAALLIAGYGFIRRRRVAAHRNCMLAAFGVSSLFLVTYVAHQAWRTAQTGDVHTVYHGQGIVRVGYYVMLISHILLAMCVPVLAIWLIRLGLTGRVERHRRLACVGYPIWLYVSITGVLIYLMLYHFNPPPSEAASVVTSAWAAMNP